MEAVRDAAARGSENTLCHLRRREQEQRTEQSRGLLHRVQRSLFAVGMFLSGKALYGAGVAHRARRARFFAFDSENGKNAPL